MNDLSQLRLTRDRAKALLEDEAFMAGLERKKAALIGQLVDEATDTTDKKLELIGGLKMVSTFAAELEAFVRDYDQAKKRQGGGHA
jgi:hypothetical protein